MRDKIINLYYDDFFKNYKGHDDWSDEEITISTCKGDVDEFIDEVKNIMYKRFDIKENK